MLEEGGREGDWKGYFHPGMGGGAWLEEGESGYGLMG